MILRSKNHVSRNALIEKTLSTSIDQNFTMTIMLLTYAKYQMINQTHSNVLSNITLKQSQFQY